ncbi:hypothetical protein, partial [Pseudomonas sp. OF001]|uniref:hypothetical protein n=1 Tax=Pseudomonas sp. OF001 TaxID=2772300 RepID=UPI001F16E119
PLAHAAQQTDLDVGALFNAEFVVRHGNTVPERSGVALSFCRCPVIVPFPVLQSLQDGIRFNGNIEN